MPEAISGQGAMKWWRVSFTVLYRNDGAWYCMVHSISAGIGINGATTDGAHKWHSLDKNDGVKH